MAERYINLNLEDPRAGIIAEALANKTCKKILCLLSEKEMRESEIAKELELPLNTTEYNLEKLVNAGLIEKSKKFLWSSKGKRMDNYRVVNKKIVISPRSAVTGVIPALIAAVIIAAGIKFFSVMNYASNLLGKNSIASSSSEYILAETTGEAAAPQMANPNTFSGVFSSFISSEYSWLWFLLGALITVLVFLIWNWRKIWTNQ